MVVPFRLFSAMVHGAHHEDHHERAGQEEEQRQVVQDGQSGQPEGDEEGEADEGWLDHLLVVHDDPFVAALSCAHRPPCRVAGHPVLVRNVAVVDYGPPERATPDVAGTLHDVMSLTEAGG